MPVNTAARSGRPQLCSADVARALDAGACKVKIADFGLSVLLGIYNAQLPVLSGGALTLCSVNSHGPAPPAPDLSHTEPVFYAAPELLLGSAQPFKEVSTPAADIFSFGVLMWQLFHGVRPFVQRGTHFHHRPSFPAFSSAAPLGYALLAVTCLAASPADRPRIQDVCESLQQLQSDLRAPSYENIAGEMRVRAAGVRMR